MEGGGLCVNQTYCYELGRQVEKPNLGQGGMKGDRFDHPSSLLIPKNIRVAFTEDMKYLAYLTAQPVLVKRQEEPCLD